MSKDDALKKIIELTESLVEFNRAYEKINRIAKEGLKSDK
jgi:hypothetical protein